MRKLIIFITLLLSVSTYSSDAARVVDSHLTKKQAAMFSPNYLKIRQNYIKQFLWHGMSAEFVEGSGDGKHIKFSDQPIYMGFAMLTFAGESKILSEAGIDSTPAERILAQLLEGFEELDHTAEKVLYGTSQPGFFVRDAVHTKKGEIPASLHGIEGEFTSDMNATLHGKEAHGFPAMSLDQTIGMFLGWWAVANWSTDTTNITIAKQQADRVIRYLMDNGFDLKLPDGRHIDRGKDLRAAAGFLCRMATATTGQNYIFTAKISLGKLSNTPVRIRDDNLGEFTIPGFSVPVSLPVILTHAALLEVKPTALVGMTVPEISVDVSKMFPHRMSETTLIDYNAPCVHLAPQHPGGHTQNTPCAHMTAAHPAGHSTQLPCAHLVAPHPGGHPQNIPCTHLTATHSGGHEIKVTCIHQSPRHSGHGYRNLIPCTHFVKAHEGGDVIGHSPCGHLVQSHPGGHTVNIACVHPPIQQHPGGHPSPAAPCAHFVQSHPAGHNVTLPCLHQTAQHPAGDPIKLNLDDLAFKIPLGSNISSYVRHMFLVCMAFEPAVNELEMLAAAKSSNHLWSMLLRAAVLKSDISGIITDSVVKGELKQIHAECPEYGPKSGGSGQWVKDNRWIRCTDLENTGTPGKSFNGLDFLSLEVLMRVTGVYD